MRSSLIAIGVVLAGLSGARAAEARERALDSVRAVCQVCWAARTADRMRFAGNAVQRGQARSRHEEARLRTLETMYTVEVPAAAFAFAEYDPDAGVLSIDTRRNFRLFDGRVELYATGNEPIAFELEAGPAGRLVANQRTGRQKLRLGFLVSFDQPEADPCLIRPASRFTVRADLAFAEIVDAASRVVARMTTERLDEFVPDAAELGGGGAQSPAPAGQVTVTPPTIAAEPRRRGAIDEWFSSEGAAAIAALLEPCRVAGARGGRVVGSLAIALDVEASGAPANVRVEMDSMSNQALSSCVVEKIGTVRFPAGRSRARVTLPLLLTRE